LAKRGLAALNNPNLSFEDAKSLYETDPVVRDAVHAEATFQGNLAWVCRRHAQLQCYEFTNSWKAAHPDEAGPIVWNCHRGMGKSFLGLLMCVERCLRLPNQEVRLARRRASRLRTSRFPISGSFWTCFQRMRVASA